MAAPLPGAVPVLLGGIAPAVLAKHLHWTWVLTSALAVSAPLVSGEWAWFALLQGLVFVVAAASPTVLRQLPWVLAAVLLAPALYLSFPAPFSATAWLLGALNLLVGVAVAHSAARQLWGFAPSRSDQAQRSLGDQIAAGAAATLWPLLVLALLALAFVGWQIELWRRSAALELRAEQAAEVVSDHLQAHKRAVAQVAADVSLPVRPPVLDGLRQTHPGFLTLLVTDAQGEIIDFRAPSPFGALRSVEDRAYFREPRRTGASYISPVFRGRGFGSDILVAVSAPYRDARQDFAGVVEGSLSLGVLRERLRRIAEQHGLQLVLTDASGTVVLSTLDALVPLEPAEGALVEAGPRWLSSPLNAAKQHTLQATTLPDLGWRVVLLEPLAPLVLLQNWSFVLVGSLALLGLLLLEKGARRFAQPFVRPLREMVGRIRELDLGVPRTLQPLRFRASSAEFSALAEDFNAMVRRLRDLSEDLRSALDAQAQLNRELEARVEERTADLAKALADAEHLAEAKTRFLSQMSHELRTPLTAILGFAEQARLAPGDAQRSAQALEVVVRNGRHLLGIVNDVLDAARIDSGQLAVVLEPCSPLALVDDVHALLGPDAELRHLRLELDCDWPLPASISTDPLRLRQALINLVGNALKFTEHGEVRIRLSVVSTQLQIEVCDTGIGISAEQLERLFKPFEQADVSVTRRFGGSGLGLFISKRWIEALGGTLEVESVLGAGSCFRIRVPFDSGVAWIASREAAVDADLEALTIPRLAGRVLVVDDVEDLRELITQTVAATGADCETASNGAEAVERALAQHFDLILLDKHMPMLDGYSAMRQLRESGYTRAIAALTADVIEHESPDGLAIGFDAMLAKPIDRSRLYSVLARFLPAGDGDTAEAAAAGAADLTPEALALSAAFAEIRARYGGRLLEECEALAQEASEFDLDAVRLRLHTLKGSAGTFGFPEVSAAAAEAEAALKEQVSITPGRLDGLLAPVVQALRAAGRDRPDASPAA
nr:ATP-binding protein [Aquimonas voraii]